jgi:hypothetical protein
VIGFNGYSQVVTISNYNTLKVTVTVTHKVFNVCLLVVASSLEFSIWMSESRTELNSCGPNIEHTVGQLIPLLFSVATEHVTISGQRVDLYKRIRSRGNVFRLAVV